jgi:hypothetical protein
MFINLCFAASKEEKNMFVKNHLNSLYPFLKITHLSSSSRNITSSPFLISLILHGLDCICEDDDASLQLWLGNIVNLVKELLKFYLPYVFTLVSSFSYRFYSPREKLFDKLCEVDESNPVYSSSLFTICSKDFYWIKQLFLQGARLVSTLLYNHMEFIEYELLEMSFDVVKEYLNHHNEKAPLRIDDKDSLHMEMTILVNVCEIIKLFCFRASEQMKFDGPSELKIQIITTGGLSLLYQLFVNFNPRGIVISETEKDRSDDEYLLYIIATCVLFLCSKGEIYDSDDEGIYTSEILFYFIFFILFLLF